MSYILRRAKWSEIISLGKKRGSGGNGRPRGNEGGERHYSGLGTFIPENGEYFFNI